MPRRLSRTYKTDVGRRVVTLLVVPLVVLLASPRASRADVTLGEVVRLALDRNERSRIARLGVVSTDAAVMKARAAFLPTLSLSGSETLRPYSVTNQASGALTVNQPLLAATAFPLYTSAKHGREAARHGEVDQRRQLAFDAARAFFTAIEKHGVLDAARRRLEKAEASLADMRARAQAQLTSSNDVTRAQVERASAAQSVATAAAGLEQARIALELLIDAPVEGELRAPEGPLVAGGVDPGQLTGQALAQRPDLASVRASAAGAAATADEPRLRFVPTLGAAGQLKLADQRMAGDRYYDATLVFSLSWSIWDAGLRAADEAAKRAAAGSADLQVQALRRRIRAEVRSALVARDGARVALKAAEEAVTAAHRNVEETSVLYKQGLAKAIELVDANLSRFTAELGLAAAQLDVRQAELDLRAALGLFPLDGVR